ncbi:MAG: FtsQ-type POTRA domain-containing protein [Gammaproteobacteria bacterium]|nr:FtsQ-type POTRA domain-containing protein [Gammaproteobacteria bacterium]
MENKQSRGRNKRQKTPAQLLMPFTKAAPFFIVLGLIIWGVLSANTAELLKADVRWDVAKKPPIGQHILKEKIQPLIQDKYQLDLHEIKLALESEPWVNKADVERLFWNSIHIKIEFQQIAMRWEHSHCKSKEQINCVGYISTQGELFIPKKITPSDAILARSKPDTNTINQLYTDFQYYRSSTDPMVIKTFSKTNIDQLTLEPNVTVILGYQKQKQRLDRFLKAYSKLKKKTKKVKRATFDMRYPKGFALSY